MPLFISPALSLPQPPKEDQDSGALLGRPAATDLNIPGRALSWAIMNACTCKQRTGRSKLQESCLSRAAQCLFIT